MHPIHTLNARDSFLLDLVKEQFAIHDPGMRREIVGAHHETVAVLHGKGIEYAGLRKALTPQSDRLEAGFVFDTGSGKQMRDFADVLIPLLDRRSGCSILCGDLIHPNQELAVALLFEHLQQYRDLEIADTSQLFCIYLNNLTKKMFEDIHAGLLTVDAYAGHIPTTYASKAKDWLSFMLTSAYVKAGTKVVNSHEADTPNDEDYNTKWWDFEEHGYDVRSIQEHYFDLFLHYKIERAVLPHFASDTRHGLSAISDAPMDLGELGVLVEEGKIGYLRTNKRDNMERAGLAELSATELADQIKAKINSDYIYNLRYDDTHDKSFFTMILEATDPASSKPARLTVGLEYRPTQNDLRLITMF